jgi:hypothetical protein
MNEERLYEILGPDSVARHGRIFRLVHHAMVTAGITHAGRYRRGVARSLWRAARRGLSCKIRLLYCGIFAAADQCRRSARRSAPPSLAGATRLGLIDRRRLRFPWCFAGRAEPCVRHRGCELMGTYLGAQVRPLRTRSRRLQRAIGTARPALLSVLLGFVVVPRAARCFLSVEQPFGDASSSHDLSYHVRISS